MQDCRVCAQHVQQGAVECCRCEIDGLHGRGGFDLAHSCGGRGQGSMRVRARGGGGRGRGSTRVRARGGRGSRGGLWVWGDDVHGIVDRHARAAQDLFATHGSALHACLCHMREVHAHLGDPDAVRDCILEAGEQVWRKTDGATPPQCILRASCRCGWIC